MIIFESDYRANNFHISRNENELSVELTYPQVNTYGGCQYILVDQESVRASDGIRLHYDYERDGWVIEQPDNNENWKETAFAQSWARERPD